MAKKFEYLATFHFEDKDLAELVLLADGKRTKEFFKKLRGKEVWVDIDKEELETHGIIPNEMYDVRRHHNPYFTTGGSYLKNVRHYMDDKPKNTLK